jgi:prophage antirepressor-like protein
MNKIKVFSHELFGDVRTMTNEKGETFFVGKDVATALGYSNTSKAIQQHVDDEDKGTLPIREGAYETRAIVINESGLYSLVLSSKLPQARMFKRWVTSEVLPAIRKTGGYIPTRDNEGRKLTDLEIVCLALKIQQKTIEEQHKTIETLEPKAIYAERQGD